VDYLGQEKQVWLHGYVIELDNNKKQNRTMKKLLTVLMVCACYLGYGQVYNLANGASAASDSTFKKTLLANGAWSIQVELKALDATDGSIEILESSNDTAYTRYSTSMYKGVSTLPYTINGAGDTIRVARFADSYFDGKIIGLKYLKGTATVGTVNAVLIFKPVR